METLFNNSQNAYGVLANIPSSGDDTVDQYNYSIRALISDAVDYEESDLARDREIALDYYDGKRPSLTAEEIEDITGDPPLDDESTANNRSTIVSTDVRDTVLGIMPSLMRIFAGSEHAVEYEPNTAEQVELAEQATDYVRYKFWHTNGGFIALYGAFWDALVTKLGILTWGTDMETTVSEKVYDKLTQDQLAMLLNEPGITAELISHDPVRQVPGSDPVIDNVRIRATKSVPSLWVEGVAPENFRISRNAKSAKTANLIGYEEIVRISDVVEKGYDYDEIREFIGASQVWTADGNARNPGGDTYYPLNDLVKWGCFWVRVDQDGDGINELREIHTIGDDYTILKDEMANAAPIALFNGDPRPHTAIGGSMTDLVKDIQRIKSNLIRGGLDSLAQSIFPRVVFNELLTNVEDVMSDDIGAAIRTRANPAEAVSTYTTPFVGDKTFEAAQYMDAIKVARTGQSDASKGIDPKAFQSTNLSGIDAIVSGAQERTELIARILAETGMKDLFDGLLQEVIDHPNKEEMVKLRGKWVNVDPSSYPADMRATVNPTLGKGSDQTRIMALQGISAAQMTIVEKFGMGNGVVGPIELRNTQADLLALVGFKNVTRYFREITPEQAKAIESAPKDPSPETILAQSQMEGVRSKTAEAISKQKQEETKIEQAATKTQLDDDFRRDKLNVDSLVALVGVFKDLAIADQAENEVETLNSRGK